MRTAEIQVNPKPANYCMKHSPAPGAHTWTLGAPSHDESFTSGFRPC